MKNSTIFVLFVTLFAVVIIAGCNTAPVDGPGDIKKNTTVDTADLSGSQDLKKFDNTEQLKEFLMNAQSNGGNNFAIRGGLVAMDSAVESATGSKTSSPAPSGANDYSQTNVQVKGVDEGDFIKNDDKYIYTISGNSLVIVDAVNGEDADIVSTTSIGDKNRGYVRDIFINDDKLVVFYESYEDTFVIQKYEIMPVPSSRSVTHVQIFDVSDRSKPKVSEEFSVYGSYFQSRMINNIVYLVSTDYVNYQYIEPPIVMAGDRKISPTVYYFDNPENNYQYNTVTSINVDTEDVVDSETFLLGYANTLMVSEDNIYIAYQKSYGCWWGWRCVGNSQDDQKERFYDIVVPILKGQLKQDVNVIISQQLGEEEQWSKISDVFIKFYNTYKDADDMDATYTQMFEDIDDALAEYDAKKEMDRSKTIIHKIGINNGKIEYKEKGEVFGSLLNQFSLDEYDGNLRVATTINIWLRNGQVNHNNVYVLNEDMKVIGSIEGIAKNESIYATRFMGDKLYMVTFRQIDPFFVIDLSNPTDPEVLGKLKIPGYSSYLHPIDNNLIIGVGKETGENEWGGVSTKGVKISLFDVSDFENPREVDKYEIGMSGTDTPILHDHRAFLYSPTKKILVIPIHEITERESKSGYGYTYKTWNGAYVFKVSYTGFELLGKVKHSATSYGYYNWYMGATVMRSLYMDNNLFTVSSDFIKINDLENDLVEINSIGLPGTQKQYYGMPIDDGGILIPVEADGGIATSPVMEDPVVLE